MWEKGRKKGGRDRGMEKWRDKGHSCSLSLSIISIVSSSMKTSVVKSGSKPGCGLKLRRNLSRGSMANWSTLRFTATVELEVPVTVCTLSSFT